MKSRPIISNQTLKVLPHGHVGVDLFFVISGFIMGTVGVTETPARFAYRRVTRISPLYWLVTLTFCGLSLVPGLMRNFSFTGEELLKSMLFIPYVNSSGQLYPLVVPGWTLNFEMFFYGIFAMAMFLPYPRLATILALLALATGGVILAPADPVMRVVTSPLVLEFAFGLLLSCGLGHRSATVGFVLFGIGLCWIAAMMGGMYSPGDGVYRVLVTGVPSLLLLAGALIIEKTGRWPSMPTAIFLGNISYSLYLTHGLVLPVLERILPDNVVVLVPIALVACVGLATVTYLGFERPATRLFRRFEKRVFPPPADWPDAGDWSGGAGAALIGKVSSSSEV